MSRATGRRRRSAQPRTVALASGKGGVGRSTGAVELARALGRHDQRTLLVELSAGQSMATLLERPLLSVAPVFEPGLDLDGHLQDTAVANVSLLALDVSTWESNGGAWTIGQFYEALRRLGFEWTIVDLPGNTDAQTVATFLGADVPLLMTNSEPGALVGTTQLLRGCVVESLRRHEDDVRAGQLADIASSRPMGWQFVDLFRNSPSEQHRTVLTQACERVVAGLLLNQVREGSEKEQALALCHAWALEIGVWPRWLGGIQYEDRRWFYARKHAPAANHPRDESMAGDLEQVARKLLSMDWSEWADPKPCLPCVDPAEEPKVFLDLRASDGVDVRQRYRRLWEGYRREGGMISFVLDSTTRQRAVRMLETAYRRAAVEQEDTPTASQPRSTDRKRPGQRLRLARMQRGLGLRELSLRTRVGVKHVEAIETMLLRELPSRVYLKAYLAEISKTLGLDADEIVDEYIAWLDETQQE